MKGVFFKPQALLSMVGLCTLCMLVEVTYAAAQSLLKEPVYACVMSSGMDVVSRQQAASCLGWQEDATITMCRGAYQSVQPPALSDPTALRMTADRASLYPAGRSQLQGHVEVQQTYRVVDAQTANVYRDAKTHHVTRIELLGDVYYREPGRVMWAKKAILHPGDKAGYMEQVLYRFDTSHAQAMLPAWGKALRVERFANQDLALHDVTYTTCSPLNRAWYLSAHDIYLDHAKGSGTAKNATLHIADYALPSLPYFSFPTSNVRKSGFLMPVSGYSNVGGFDLATPYYWNIAPNYDATIVPHMYTLRGLMMGGDLRFLTPHSLGVVGGQFLPKDAAFHHFLTQNQQEFPILQGESSNRWSFLMHDHTQFTNNLALNVNFQQVSDPYYLQDFSTNLATITENQLLREGQLTYATDHWLFGGMVQSYQTLHPVNQSFVANIYDRLPQVLAQGVYSDLPMHAQLQMLGQIDEFHWPDSTTFQPEGPRYHANPILAFPHQYTWGYVTPEVQLVENYYHLSQMPPLSAHAFNRTIPRASVDGSLIFERTTHAFDQPFVQTLEPRLYYLNVPYQNQSAFPAFDSAYMIFNMDQVFRNNRFSGFDRIGDANQLAYAVTSRLLSSSGGEEKASLAVGQIRYFAKRRVELCYAPDGQCVDNPLFLGYTSPEATTSPLASRATYHLNPQWIASADYIWDPFTHATNNGNLNLHYQLAADKIFNIGYSYLVNGNLIVTPQVGEDVAALHQATVSYAWPFNEQWSSLGVYSYNLSKGYNMVNFLGVQYDTCCWAVRLLGGRTFQSLSPNNAQPQYNNNVYVQILLKGLGTVANSNPSSTIQSYLPGYRNIFQH